MACLPVRGGVGASAWVKRTGRCCCCRGVRCDDGGGFFALRRWTGVWRVGRSAEPPRRRCRHAPWERQPPPRAPRAMAGAMGSRRAMGVVGRGRGGPVEPSGPQHGQRRQPVPEDGWGWEQGPGPAKAAVPAAQGRRFAGAMKRDTEMKQARAWRSPDNGRKRCCATARATLFQGCSGWGRRTSGVGDQAMGGLMVSAGGALSNRADAVGSAVPRRRRVQDAAGAASSIAEWQISQAEHAAEW